MVADDDVRWMTRALELARRAEEQDEVPVGAVLVLNGSIVGEGWNQTITEKDPTAHAEVMALRDAGHKLNNYRLPGAELFVTLEPCCMCVGAIIHARVARVVYGANDPKTGADGGRFSLLRSPEHNHQPQVQTGVLAEQSSKLLRAFFKRRR